MKSFLITLFCIFTLSINAAQPPQKSSLVIQRALRKALDDKQLRDQAAQTQASVSLLFYEHDVSEAPLYRPPLPPYAFWRSQN